MSLANEMQILISYMRQVGGVLSNPTDKEYNKGMYDYFFGKSPKKTMLQKAIGEAIRQKNGNVNYAVLDNEFENRELMLIVIGNLKYMYDHKKTPLKFKNDGHSNSKSNSQSLHQASPHVPPMTHMKQSEKVKRGKMHNAQGEHIELIALNSYGSAKNSNSSNPRKSSTSSTRSMSMSMSSRRKSSPKRSNSSESWYISSPSTSSSPFPLLNNKDSLEMSTFSSSVARGKNRKNRTKSKNRSRSKSKTRNRRKGKKGG